MNLLRPTLKLESKEREGSRIQRHYSEAQTPYARVLANAQVTPAKQAELRALKARLNPFALAAQVERELKAIAAPRCRRNA